MFYSVVSLDINKWHNSIIDKRNREMDEAQLAHFSYLKKISALLWLCFGSKSSLFTIYRKEKTSNIFDVTVISEKNKNEK